MRPRPAPSTPNELRRRARLVLAAALALGAGGVTAARAGGPEDELAALGTQLVERRQRIDALATRIELDKADLRDRLHSLAEQRADLERQLKRLEVESTELDRDLAREDAALAVKRAAREGLVPVAREAAQRLRAAIAAGVPFQTASRLQQLEDLERALAAADAAPDQVLARLWSAVEDELRLTREIGLYRQEVELDGQRQLAEVAKLGTALLYLRTLDGKVGMAVPGPQGYSFRLVADREDQRRIEGLFESLRKHVREGRFDLPNPLHGAQGHGAHAHGADGGRPAAAAAAAATR